ncbi:putative trans-sialidase, partial [Trypanosoma cruzi]
LLLVVMICCSSGGATQAVEDLPADPKYQLEDANEEGVSVKSLGVPGLLKVGSGVFAVAEAQCKKKDGEDTFTGIASQLLTIKNDNTPEEVLTKARVIRVLEEGAPTSKELDVSGPTTVVRESNIYMVVGKYSRKGGQGSDADDWGLLLVKGTVSDKESNKQIEWKDTSAVPTTTLGEQPSSLTGLIGSGGSGVKMKDGTLVFPLEGTKKKDDVDAGKDGKTTTVSLVLHLQDTKNWKLSKGMSADGCSDPSVVEWKDKLMMMTACGDGRRRVYESGDKGESWTEALGTLSRVWGNKKDGEGKAVRSGFTTATIDGEDNRNVMLVTLPVYPKEKEKGELHLWLTDNTHIVDIGPVSGKDDDAAASALLYKSVTSGTDDNNEELVALYEKKKGDEKENPSPGMVSVLLTEQLQRVKDVLANWKKVDKRVSELCPSESAVQVTSPESACKNTKITAGLVGFLSGNFSDGKWRDEYLGVNATVKKGAKEGASAEKAETAESSDGVKFTGAWAEWPVGSQGENQLYHFANYNFTLVATVSIDGVPKEGNIPVMGAILKDAENPVLLGLSYNNKEKKWTLLCGDGKVIKEHSSTWETRTDSTQYRVAIVLQNGTQGSAYVDGRRVGEPCKLEGKEDRKISHFYIGGDGVNAGNTESQGGVSVTVTNVLLYNRPLSSEEITALNTKLSIPKARDEKAVKEVTPPPEASEPVTLETGTLSILGEQQQNKQDPLRKSENAGSGGLFASGLPTATTSPAAKESEKQSASGASPSGNKNVDGTSSS